MPLIVYDNPGTTHFTFTDQPYGRIAELPGVASIKIPGIPAGMSAHDRIAQVRAVVPEHISIGISGDAFAAAALSAGADVWYSAIGGTLPVCSPSRGLTPPLPRIPRPRSSER